MNVECDKNGRNKGTKCGIANEKEILKDRNVNVSKRQSTSRNKHMDSHKTDYKNSPHKNYASENSFYDENDSTSVDEASDRCRKSKKPGIESNRDENKDRKRKNSRTNTKKNSHAQYEHKNHVLPSPIKDSKTQKPSEILEDTYNLPLDVSDLPSSHLSSRRTNTRETIEEFYPPENHNVNDRELVQLQQLWLLNRSTAPNEYVEDIRMERNEIDDSNSVSSEQSNLSPIDGFQTETSPNIYMEVEPR